MIYDYAALKYDLREGAIFPAWAIGIHFSLWKPFSGSPPSAFLYGRWSPLVSDLLLCDNGLNFANEGYPSSCFAGDQTDFRLQLYT